MKHESIPMVLRALLLWLLLSSLLAAPPDYTRLRLHEMAVRADVVVSGEISEVGQGTFDFVVDDVVVGQDVPARLRVKRFQNWICHGRWAEYKRGERLMLFLVADEQRSPGLFILGSGDEGEMPFAGDGVVMVDAYNLRVSGFPVETHKVLGGTVEGSKLPYQELRAAILGFREHVGWKVIKYRLQLWSRVGSRSLDAYMESSKIARHLAKTAQSSRGWVGLRPGPDVLLERPGPGKMVGSETQSPGPFLVAPDRGLTRGEFGLARGQSGLALALIGDVDGDGIGDLALGDPWDDRLDKRRGALWILFLDKQGNVRGRTEISEGLGGFSGRLERFAAFGKSVAGLGDLDRGGVPDLVVGAPGWNGDSAGRGAAWVLFLKRDGTVKGARELGGAGVLRAVGAGKESGFGNALASLGDLDGDGNLELAIGQDPALALSSESGRTVLIVSLDSKAGVQHVRQLHNRHAGFDGDGGGFGDALAAVGTWTAMARRSL